MKKQNRMLKEIIVCLGEKWLGQYEVLKRKVSDAGIICREYEMVPIIKEEYTVLITDCVKEAVKWNNRGGICIGCSEASSGFFDGADLVVESLDDLDEIIIEETLLRGLGLPVTIAETQRLIIREITRDDVDKLYQISMQEGMQYLMKDSNGNSCFEPERMLPYIENVYRFYGYGLWSVWTKTGELIGCCGLSEFERRTASECPHYCRTASECPRYCRTDSECPRYCRTDSECTRYCRTASECPRYCRTASECPLYYEGATAEDSKNQSQNSEVQMQTELYTSLELQYMVAPKYQRQGYGMEMCTAALDYAFNRTDWEEVWVRIHPDNQESIRLAQKLGFLPEKNGKDMDCVGIMSGKLVDTEWETLI